MRSKHEIEREVYESSGIHIPQSDPLWALYDLIALCEKDFIVTYKQIKVEVEQNLKEQGLEYSKNLVESSQRYAETIIKAAEKLDLVELKRLLETVNKPAPAAEAVTLKELPKGASVDVTNRMTQLFFANLCVLGLNLVIFLVAAYL